MKRRHRLARIKWLRHLDTLKREKEEEVAPIPDYSHLPPYARPIELDGKLIFRPPRPRYAGFYCVLIYISLHVFLSICFAFLETFVCFFFFFTERLKRF